MSRILITTKPTEISAWKTVPCKILICRLDLPAQSLLHLLRWEGQGFTVPCCLSRSISRVSTSICFSCALSFMLRQPKKSVRIANGSPMIAIIATRIPINHAIGVFTPSIFASTYDFIRVSELSISLFVCSFRLLSDALTINRILSRSASVNSAKVGNHAMAEKSIERTRIGFHGYSSASLMSPSATVGGWQKTEWIRS